MGQGEFAVLCFVIDERTLFFFKRWLPWSSPLKASLFKLLALASYKKKKNQPNPKKRHVLGLLHDLCLHKNI